MTRSELKELINECLNERARPQRYTIYKANKKGDGIASQFNLRTDETAIFLQMASQTDKMSESGHPLFDWEESKSIFKMGISDISEVLCVLEGKKPKVGAQDGKFAGSLFHQNKSGNSSLSFDRCDRGGYYMNLGIKKGEKLKKYGQHITDAEARGLSVLFRRAIEQLYNW